MNTRTVESAALSLPVAVDESANSDKAVRLAASLGAAGGVLRCVLLHVQKPLMAGEVGAILPASVVMPERTLRAGDILDAAAAVLRASGVEFTVVQKTNEDAAAAILASARDPGCHAIVVGRRRQGALRAVLLGLVSASVVREATVLVACDDLTPARHAAAAAAQVVCHARGGGVRLAHVRPDLTVAGAIFGPREQLVQH